MKKLIAISVVFALVAGAAFAADISAEVIGMTNIISGDTGKDVYVDKDGKIASESHKVTAGGYDSLKRVRVVGAGENDDGTFGSWFRFEHYGDNKVGADGTNLIPYGNLDISGNAWWKPVEQLKFLLGNNHDGLIGMDGMTRWGFYQVAGDVGIPKEHWGFGASFYEGWNKTGGLLFITPTEGLEINLAIPFTSEHDEAKYTFLKSVLQFAYTAEGLGKFGLTYESGRGNVKAEDYKVERIDTPASTGAPAGGFNENTGEWDAPAGSGTAASTKYKLRDTRGAIDDPGKLFLFAGLTMIENLEIDIGLGYRLAHTSEGYSKQDPIAIGLGAHYNGGDFGVKGRLQLQLAGSEKVEGKDAYKDPMNIIFDVLPYYNISDSLAFLFSLGVNYTAKSGNEIDKDGSYAVTGFHATPYITIKSSWWAPNFYAGIDIRTDGTKYKDGAESKDGTSVTNWSVPIGIVVAF